MASLQIFALIPRASRRTTTPPPRVSLGPARPWGRPPWRPPGYNRPMTTTPDTPSADTPSALAVELVGLTPSDAVRITEAIAANYAPNTL